MTFDSPSKGFGLGTALSATRHLDPRDVASIEALRAYTAEMFGPNAHAIETGLITTLQRRRAAAKAHRLDVLRRPSRGSVFLATGEMLLRSNQYTPEVAEHLMAEGWRKSASVGCDELEDELVRMEHPTADGNDIGELVRRLRGWGVRASVNHMTPLAPVGKATGGAEPARGLGRFMRTETTGTPTRVAVVDSGLPKAQREDGWLAAIPRNGNEENLYGADGKLTRAAGHGAFVAGIVQRTAPEADVSVYRAELSDAIGSEIDVAAAMIRAVKDGNDIVNLSLGSQTIDDLPPVSLEAAFEVIERWEQEAGKHVLFVAAAGNYGDSRPCWPAAFRRVVSVGAVLPTGAPAPWSSYGDWVTCCTVGDAIRSTYVPGTESAAFDPRPDTFDEKDPWAWWSGTSFAAPQVTGVLASAAQKSGRAPREELVTLLANGPSVAGLGAFVPGVE